MSGPASSSSSSSAVAALLRPVRPLHFHAGPNPTAALLAAAAAKAAAADAAAAEALALAGPPPRVELYRHALECVFSCLELPDLHSVISVSKDWKGAVLTMPSQMQKLRMFGKRAPFTAIVSSLARHIGQLFTNRMTSPVLFLANQRAPQLSVLECFMDLPQPEPMVFPRLLRSITLEFTEPMGPADANAVLGAFKPLSVLRFLRLTFPVYHTHLSFAALADLPNLSVLQVSFRGILPVTGFTDAQAEQFRSLPLLTSLLLKSFHSFSTKLLQAPHALQWRTVSDPIRGRLELSALLAGQLVPLGSLTHLHANVHDSVEDLDFLQEWNRLEVLDLQLEEFALGTDVLTRGLQQAVNVTELVLRRCELTTANLRVALAAMTKLRLLFLERLPQLEQLSFLTAAGTNLPNTLESLTLDDCRFVKAAELIHLQGMRKLSSLALLGSLYTELDGHSLSLYRQRPCILIPALESFQYVGFEDDE